MRRLESGFGHQNNFGQDPNLNRHVRLTATVIGNDFLSLVFYPIIAAAAKQLKIIPMKATGIGVFELEPG